MIGKRVKSERVLVLTPQGVTLVRSWSLLLYGCWVTFTKFGSQLTSFFFFGSISSLLDISLCSKFLVLIVLIQHLDSLLLFLVY